ncbi:MAG: glycosyltransferase family 2 protein [Atopostipes suicloacalis]|nr:glycosyltransferase family 2 protein [Atopostipes suicloacalis]
MNNNDLISIIMPTYNAVKYISETIESILDQTYENWELIIVDDCSVDETISVIGSYTDDRIRLVKLSENKGAAIARNTALQKVSGKYIAFLDSDDLWHKDKLNKQLKFMQKNNYLFTSTDYAEINESGEETGKVIKSHPKLDYNGVLKYCPGNSTVMYNAEKLGIFFIPDIKRRNDFVMWLQVIKKAEHIYGLPEILTYYRVREGSLSKDKKKLIKYQWKVYRNIEKLPLVKSIFLLFHKIYTVLKKK